jgi:hypothetical protein
MPMPLKELYEVVDHYQLQMVQIDLPLEEMHRAAKEDCLLLLQHSLPHCNEVAENCDNVTGTSGEFVMQCNRVTGFGSKVAEHSSRLTESGSEVVAYGSKLTDVGSEVANTDDGLTGTDSEILQRDLRPSTIHYICSIRPCEDGLKAFLLG